MLVKEVMNKDVKTIDPDATVKEAAEIMNEFRIGSLVVVKGGEVVGIITERTILTHVVAKAKSSNRVKVGDIMVKKLIIAEPDMSLEDAADLMVKHKIKKLPVVAAGALIGIVTASDLITYEKRLIEKVASLMVVVPKVRIAG